LALFFVAEKTTPTLFNLVIVKLEEESEFFQRLYVVNIYDVNSLDLFFASLLLDLQEKVIVLRFVRDETELKKFDKYLKLTKSSFY
jgi:hypothetical protein